MTRAFGGEASGFDEAAICASERRLGFNLPDSLRTGYHEVCEGRLAFRIEHQNCARWAIDVGGDGDDPEVLLQINNTWRPAGGPVSSFLIHVALSESVLAAEHAFDRPVDDGEVALMRRVLRRLDIEPFTFWADPGGAIEFYADSDTLIMLQAETWLWAAGLDDAAVRRLRSLHDPGPSEGTR